MFLAKKIDQNIYVVFKDGSYESKNLLNEIKKELKDDISKQTIEKIKIFLDKNKAIDSNRLRQKNYTSYLKTYIDISEEKQTIFLNIYVIPKDITLISSGDIDKDIRNIEKLSFDIFRLFSTLTDKKDKKLLAQKESKGENFLDFELDFYIKELNSLYDYLLNYNRTLKDKVIVSDKEVGIPIDDLNLIEPNKLKIYQYVKISHQNDLIIFIYSLVDYLKDKRLVIFKNHKKYNELKKIKNKIYNYLLKISSTKHIKKEAIKSKKLNEFFSRFNNSQEIKKNKKLYEILESIFYNQLKEEAFIFQTVDMTYMFEKLIENKLKNTYGNNLNIGDEKKKTFIGSDKNILDERKYLLENKMGQYPDFVIKKDNIFHIIDAKYKIEEKLFIDSDAFRQVIVYSKLFNQKVDVEKVKKMLIYAKTTNIELNEYNNIEFIKDDITLEDGDTCKELFFNVDLKILGLKYFIIS